MPSKRNPRNDAENNFEEVALRNGAGMLLNLNGKINEIDSLYRRTLNRSNELMSTRDTKLRARFNEKGHLILLLSNDELFPFRSRKIKHYNERIPLTFESNDTIYYFAEEHLIDRECYPSNKVIGHDTCPDYIPFVTEKIISNKLETVPYQHPNNYRYQEFPYENEDR